MLVVAGHTQTVNYIDSTEIYNYGIGGNSWTNVNPYPIQVSWPIGITIDNKLIMTGKLIDLKIAIFGSQAQVRSRTLRENII